MNETKKQFADYLEAEKIAFSISYVGETLRDNNWQCDAWRVAFAAGKSRFETDYYTGLGHRKPLKHISGTIKPVSPCAADVLYSLILDSSAINTSFEYWCSDYGYDSDSISAFDTYLKCCEIAKDLRRVFNHKQIETLRSLLEDY